MQYHFINESQNQGVILFFAGWGVDYRPFSHWNFPGYDILICYNYSSLEFNRSLVKEYKEVVLVAWSFGVWVASRCLKDSDIKFAHTMAINGTVQAIDDNNGIPNPIFDGTLNRLSSSSLEKFNLRMCGGNRELLSQYKEYYPERDIDSLTNELSFIGREYRSSESVSFFWDEVIIGSRDLIFPTTNQLNGWSEHPNVNVIEIAHYADFSTSISNSLTNR
ncbi:MAG: pimeloyl-ACP methyl esterase BioG family protein [Bacteroidales bacterium]